MRRCCLSAHRRKGHARADFDLLRAICRDSLDEQLQDRRKGAGWTVITNPGARCRQPRINFACKCGHSATTGVTVSCTLFCCCGVGLPRRRHFRVFWGKAPLAHHAGRGDDAYFSLVSARCFPGPVIWCSRNSRPRGLEGGPRNRKSRCGSSTTQTMSSALDDICKDFKRAAGVSAGRVALTSIAGRI